MSWSIYYEGRRAAFTEIMSMCKKLDVTIGDLFQFAQDNEAACLRMRNGAEKREWAEGLKPQFASSEPTEADRLQTSYLTYEQMMRPENRCPVTGPEGDGYHDGSMCADIEGNYWLFTDSRWKTFITSKKSDRSDKEEE